MRSLRNNKHADMNMIMTAIIMAVMLAIGLVVVYSVFGGLDLDTVDTKINEDVFGWSNSGDPSDDQNSSWESWNTSKNAANATNDLLNNAATFFTVAPIALVVIAAVGILGYVLLLRRS